MQSRENRDIEYLFKFYDGLTVVKHRQNSWELTDPKLKGRWLRVTNVNYWLLSMELSKELPPL